MHGPAQVEVIGPDNLAAIVCDIAVFALYLVGLELDVVLKELSYGEVLTPADMNETVPIGKLY